MRTRKLISLLICSCFALCLNAQSFRWQAKLDSTTANGFYKIQLSPLVISKLQSGFDDVRIWDNQNKEVPYIFQQAESVTYSSLFKEYKVLSIDKSHKRTTLLLENPDKKKIDNIELVVKNADITKMLRLSGSDDKQNWYIIKDNYFISDVFSNMATSTVKIFDFPLSDYRYFKIEISDSESPAINVLKAGYYDSYSEAAKYTATPDPTLTQTDSTSAKETYVKIVFPDSELIDKLYFTVMGPHYYYRGCSLGNITQRTLKNGTIEKSYEPVNESFTLSSNGENIIYLNAYKGKTIYLRIENKDNPPLKITGIKAYEIGRYLYSYLQKGQRYSLVFGNKASTAPDYDLANFKDSITNATRLNVGSISAIAVKAQQTASKDSSALSNKALIWVALIIVLLILGFMSMRIIKEMGNK